MSGVLAVPALADFQQRFAQAVLDEAAPSAELPDWARQPAFAVYRNTVLKGCIDTLQANFPSVARLVGDAWFRAAAAEHARSAPPTDTRLVCYGAAFPNFLDQLLARSGHGDALPYLADVARLDRFWSEAHTAADAPAADAAWLAALAPEALATAVLPPHPAARWAWFGDAPVFAIWRRQREQGGPDLPIAWQPDGALLTRPDADVQWAPASAAACAFLDACAAGQPLERAADAALQAEPDTDLGALLQLLLRAGALQAPNTSTTEPLP